MGCPALTHAKLLNWLLLLLLTLLCPPAAASLDEPKPSSRLLPHYEPDHEDAVGSLQEKRLQVFTLDYNYVQIPYEVTLWILLASFAKIGK